eukprot:jgi/Hompol1/3763/HPOL_006730-RA
MSVNAGNGVRLAEQNALDLPLDGGSFPETAAGIPSDAYTGAAAPVSPYVFPADNRSSSNGRLGRHAATTHQSQLAETGFDVRTQSVAASITPLLTDAATAPLTALESVPRKPIACIALAPDGRAVYAGTSDGAIHCWQLPPADSTAFSAFNYKPQPSQPSQPSHYRQFAQGHDKSVTAIHAAGAFIFSCSEDGTARIWDAASGTCQRTIKVQRGFVTAICFTDGLLYTGGEDAIVSAWSVNKGRRQWVLPGHTGWITSLVVSDAIPERLFSASTDKSIRIWDTANGRELHVLSGHQEWVHTLALDSRFVYS